MVLLLWGFSSFYTALQHCQKFFFYITYFLIAFYVEICFIENMLFLFNEVFIVRHRIIYFLWIISKLLSDFIKITSLNTVQKLFKNFMAHFQHDYIANSSINFSTVFISWHYRNCWIEKFQNYQNNLQCILLLTVIVFFSKIT